MSRLRKYWARSMRRCHAVLLHVLSSSHGRALSTRSLLVGVSLFDFYYLLEKKERKKISKKRGEKREAEIDASRQLPIPLIKKNKAYTFV